MFSIFRAAWIGQAIRFGIVGFANTAVGLSVTLALMWSGFGDVTANFCGYLVGFIFSYVMNARWTFKVRRSQVVVIKYVLLMALCYCLNLLVMLTLRDFAGLDRHFAQLGGMIAYSVAGFLGSRTVVFKNREPKLENHRAA
ncbi:GtrA family protein [Rhizobium sp. FY34]|uniref:GtrA family protein n=1 Tax=Rhizobium sp. FY34 TaxID=2562309 RepID=UPI0010C12339|nr:GtrA family protein [Rhizobium sp. FY34]